MTASRWLATRATACPHSLFFVFPRGAWGVNIRTFYRLYLYHLGKLREGLLLPPFPLASLWTKPIAYLSSIHTHVAKRINHTHVECVAMLENTGVEVGILPMCAPFQPPLCLNMVRHVTVSCFPLHLGFYLRVFSEQERGCPLPANFSAVVRNKHVATCHQHQQPGFRKCDSGATDLQENKEG